MKSLRFWLVVVMLVSADLLLHSRSGAEIIPVSESLSELPLMIAGWNGSNTQIDQEVLNVLGPGEFVSRVYTREPESEPIGLFIAYFPTQRTGVSVHSPKNCLPGAGWDFESSRYVDLKDATGRSHQVGEYVISNGEERQFVIYWYQAHGRSIASEYWAKVHMVIDAMRMDRTDGALVRVATPISRSEGDQQARNRTEIFARQLAPVLPRFIPN